ncbi:hypothetical protein C0991_003606, partial [Blastosporella zonata]
MVGKYLLVLAPPTIHRGLVLATCNNEDNGDLFLTDTLEEYIVVGFQDSAEARRTDTVYEETESTTEILYEVLEVVERFLGSHCAVFAFVQARGIPCNDCGRAVNGDCIG